MKKKLYSFVFVFITVYTHAQVYSGGASAIPNGGRADMTINVSGVTPTKIDTANFGLEYVCVNATFPSNYYLYLYLKAPDGSIVVLTTGNSPGTSDMNVCFMGDASKSIVAATQPIAGNYRPQDALGNLNNGQNPNGTWTLIAMDTDPFSANNGSISSWSIRFGNKPAKRFAFKSSNLPVISIDTKKQIIVNEPKIVAEMKVFYKGPGIRNYATDLPNYKGNVGIEMRGAASQTFFPKKSYGFETLDLSYNEMDTSLLGMPAESDWILSGSYFDKSLIQNVLTSKIAADQGHYAPRTRLCELVINGQYQGVYVLTEKIKRNQGRVSIAKLTTLDNAGDSLTGGYILKIDKGATAANSWESGKVPVANSQGQRIKFQYVYPKETIITTPQKNYIKAYVDSFENALAGPNFKDLTTGYRNFIGINSFIDYFIVNEISRNLDAYRISTYLYKDKESKGSGRLKIGPVWDYDLAWGSCALCNSDKSDGWQYQLGTVCASEPYQPPFWWKRLLEDPYFTDQLNCRWKELRASVLDTTYLFNYIDSLGLILNEAQVRNFKVWPVLGVYIFPSIAPVPATFSGELNRVKKWIRNRFAWIEANLPGACPTFSVADGVFPPAIEVHPNPFHQSIDVTIDVLQSSTIEIELINTLGKKQLLYPPHFYPQGRQQISMQLAPDLPQGIYLLGVTVNGHTNYRKVIKQ